LVAVLRTFLFFFDRSLQFIHPEWLDYVVVASQIDALLKVSFPV
jgi:hypothetical protein